MALLILLCELLGGAFAVPRSDIEHVVRQYVSGCYQGSSADVVVEFRSVPDRLVVRGKKFTLRVSESATPVPRGNVSFSVEALSEGRVDQTFMVSVKVRTFDTVLVTARQLGRHESLAPQDVRRERIETTALRGTPLVRDFRVGLRTTRIVTAGSVLTGDLTDPVPDVLEGSSVTLIVRGKNFRFSSNAVAREDGVIDHQVMVQRAGSAVRIPAIVVDRNTVEMRVQ